MFTEIGRSENVHEHVVQGAKPDSFFSVSESEARIRIVALGIGGMGQNAMENLALENVEGLEIYSINTDMQALSKCKGSQAIQIGKKRTCGRGAGGDSEIGRLSAEDDIETLKDIITGAELVFIAAGMGGGTGTGAAPVIGRICSEMGIMAIGVVTTPMHYEGIRRIEKATTGLSSMRRAVDSMMIVENEKLSLVMKDEDISIINAFKKADGVLVDALKSITRMINLHGYINLDLADLNNVLKRQSGDVCGDIMIGVGEARGEDRASNAALMALDNPLLANSDIHGSLNLLINVAGSEDMGLQEALSAVKIIEDKAGEMDREIFMGVVADDNLGDSLCVTVIANGIGSVLKMPAKNKESEKIEKIGQRNLEEIEARKPIEKTMKEKWSENIVSDPAEKISQLSKQNDSGADRIVNRMNNDFEDDVLVTIKREIVDPNTLRENIIENEAGNPPNREKFVQINTQPNVDDMDEYGRLPIVDKEIWKTPAGTRRQLLIQNDIRKEPNVVSLEKKGNEKWRNRVINDDVQASILDTEYQVACS